MSRPSNYTSEIASLICDRLANGETLRAICQDDIFPARSTIQHWFVNDVEGFADQYNRARNFGLDVMAEDLIAISDASPGFTPQGGTDAGAVAHARLRVDTRKWYLSKLAPKRYGDNTKIELTGANDGPISFENKASLLSDILAKAETRKKNEDDAIEGLV